LRSSEPHRPYFFCTYPSEKRAALMLHEKKCLQLDEIRRTRKSWVRDRRSSLRGIVGWRPGFMPGPTDNIPSNPSSGLIPSESCKCSFCFLRTPSVVPHGGDSKNRSTILTTIRVVVPDSDFRRSARRLRFIQAGLKMSCSACALVGCTLSPRPGQRSLNSCRRGPARSQPPRLADAVVVE
jgi:hypothetical protein